MHTVKFSIIMPFFKSETYIREAVQSVVNQTYPNWELIAVNDGSPDSSEDIVKSFMDDRIQIIHKKNGGYSSAINCGLDILNGDYFLMMGSDDQLCPKLLEISFERIQEKLPDFIVFKVKKHYIDGTKKDKLDPSTQFEKSIDYCGSYSSFYYANKYEAKFFGLRDTGKIYKKASLGNLRYFGSYGFDADGIFALLFAHRCQSFSILPYEGYIWNLHSDSLSGRKISISTQLERLENWINFIKHLKKMKKKELASIDYAYSIIGYGVISDIEKNDQEAFFSNFLLIYKYFFHLRTFWFRKRMFKGLSKKILLNSYLPITFHVIDKIKKRNKNEGL